MGRKRGIGAESFPREPLNGRAAAISDPKAERESATLQALLSPDAMTESPAWHRECFLVIIMFSFLRAFVALGSIAISCVSAQTPVSVSPADLIHELNLARQSPAPYAAHLEEMRPNYQGAMYLAPGAILLRTREGARALEEAIRYLHQAAPQSPLNLSPGMCLAAADHCREQSGGRMGHTGRNHSRPGDRISRYGAWKQSWGENITYGQHTAREAVIALLIDDGIRDRGHRKNVFSEKFNIAGAAFGPHARFGTICSIDFAGGYLDRAVASAGR